MDIKEQKQDEQKSPWEESGPIHQKGNLDQIEKLIEQNLRLTEEIYKMTKKINHFILWSRIFGVIKILIIAVPVILGIIYLPPILKDAFDKYKNLIGIGQNPKEGLVDSESQFNLDDINPNQLSPELRRLLGR